MKESNQYSSNQIEVYSCFVSIWRIFQNDQDSSHFKNILVQ